MKALIKQANSATFLTLVFTLVLSFVVQMGFSLSYTLPKWGADPFAERYKVQISKDYDFYEIIKDIESVSTEITVDLDPGTYYIRVAGIVSEFQGVWSDVREFIVAGSAHYTPAATYTTNYYYYLAINFYYWSKREDIEIKDQLRSIYLELSSKYYHLASSADKYYVIPTSYNEKIQTVDVLGGRYPYVNPKYFVLHRKIHDIIQLLYRTATHYHTVRQLQNEREWFTTLLKIDPFNEQARRFLELQSGANIIEQVARLYQQDLDVAKMLASMQNEIIVNDKPLKAEEVSKPAVTESTNATSTAVVEPKKEDVVLYHLSETEKKYLDSVDRLDSSELRIHYVNNPLTANQDKRKINRLDPFDPYFY